MRRWAPHCNWRTALLAEAFVPHESITNGEWGLSPQRDRPAANLVAFVLDCCSHQSRLCLLRWCVRLWQRRHRCPLPAELPLCIRHCCHQSSTTTNLRAPWHGRQKVDASGAFKSIKVTAVAMELRYRPQKLLYDRLYWGGGCTQQSAQRGSVRVGTALSCNPIDGVLIGT
jgi:hypothetical protein